MKAVFLRPEGQAPTWDPAGRGHAYADAKIVAARASGDIVEQKKLFKDFAVHLHRSRFAENSIGQDHSDDAEWLRRLAIYFGWSEEFRNRIDAGATREAYEVGQWALDDLEEEPPS